MTTTARVVRVSLQDMGAMPYASQQCRIMLQSERGGGLARTQNSIIGRYEEEFSTDSDGNASVSLIPNNSFTFPTRYVFSPWREGNAFQSP